ncbi:MAG: hydrolase [Gammaproteobacteria bacterium]
MIIDSQFKPAWWLPEGHTQTIYPSLFRKTRLPQMRRERLELPDGDFIDLDWAPDNSGPLVLMLHGLEGSINSHYAAGLVSTLYKASMSVVFMHFRGCSGEPNRLSRSYHSGDTGDLNFMIDKLRDQYPGREIYVLGVSLGGNVLLKWLGETGSQSGINRAMAISVPFELGTVANCLEQGSSRIYQRYLLNKLLRSLNTKKQQVDMPLTTNDIRQLTTLRSFDEAVTAPLNGFKNANDYYTQSSCRRFIADIKTPTLILHAEDDPFMNPSVIPKVSELGDGVILEIAKHGGHVGFITGSLPMRPDYWLDKRVLSFFSGI